MVEFINYKGEKYPIRISYYVLQMVQKESGKNLSEMDEDFEVQKDILWYALVAGHKMADKTLTIPREDMVWVLDECYMEFQQAMYSFAKSLVDIQQGVFNESDTKKK